MISICFTYISFNLLGSYLLHWTSLTHTFMPYQRDSKFLRKESRNNACLPNLFFRIRNYERPIAGPLLPPSDHKKLLLFVERPKNWDQRKWVSLHIFFHCNNLVSKLPTALQLPCHQVQKDEMIDKCTWVGEGGHKLTFSTQCTFSSVHFDFNEARSEYCLTQKNKTIWNFRPKDKNRINSLIHGI